MLVILIESVSEQSAKENIWTQEGGSNKRKRVHHEIWDSRSGSIHSKFWL